MCATGCAMMRFSAVPRLCRIACFGVVPGQEVEGGFGSGQNGGKAKEHQRHAGEDQWRH